MKTHTAIWLLACLAPLCLNAEEVVTEPLGFNKVTCLPNSDTIVGVPFRSQGSKRAALSQPPAVSGDSVTLTLGVNFLVTGELTAHFLKFIDGDREGRWYDIQTAANGGTANTTNAVTISLNGDTIGGATTDNKVIIAQYWTLDTLFPPAGTTNSWTETPVGSGNWVPNGHAIVASINTLGTGRRTEVLFPDFNGIGTNLAAEGRYYIHNNLWKRSNSGNANYGWMRVFPDTHIRISHPSLVSRPTVFRTLGEVETSLASIPLSTQQTIAQDNYVALPRPISLTLNQLNLLGTSAFVSSANTLGSARRDELLVFDNALQLRNKTPSFRYYVHSGIWKLHNGGNTDRGTETIAPGAGMIIRKYLTANGATVFWTNTPSY